MSSINLGFPPVGAGPKTGQGFYVYEHNYFGGAWTAVDAATVDGRGALTANNVRFYGKSVQTRPGFGQAFTLTGQTSSWLYRNPFNWLSSLGNYLVWFNSDSTHSGGGVRGTLVSSIADVQLFAYSSPAGTFASFAAVGPRLWFVPYNLTATNEVEIITNAWAITSNSGTFAGDAVIPGPFGYVPAGGTITDPSTGTVTAGLHYLGYRMLHRSGFLGRPGPDNTISGGTPTPTTYVPVAHTAPGQKNINWTFTPSSNWPNDVIQVQLVMSPVSNKNRVFLVPGATQAVTGGSATTVNITFNIDDATLIATATECTNSLDWYTANAAGGNYMQVADVENIGTRMYYVSTLPDALGNNYSVVFASDPGEYEQITKDQHVLQLPNQLAITRPFSVQGGVYLAGPHWTYATQDTGGVPSTWPTPRLVDGNRGAIFPQCVEVNSQGLYAWIADKTGLYFFNGAYADRPISYYQRDLWNQINFSRPGFTVKDDILKQQVRVMCYIGAPSGNLKVMIWDYTLGKDPESARFSIDDPPGGGMEIVQNDLSTLSGASVLEAKNPEVWFAPDTIPSTSATFFREKNEYLDSSIYQDDYPAGTTAIATTYVTPIFPVPGGEYDNITHVGCKMRITGSGLFTPRVMNYDQSSTITLSPSISTLASIPTGRLQFWGFMNSPNGFIYKIQQNAVGSHFTLSEIDMYYNDFGTLL